MAFATSKKYAEDSERQRRYDRGFSFYSHFRLMKEIRASKSAFTLRQQREEEALHHKSGGDRTVNLITLTRMGARPRR